LATLRNRAQAIILDLVQNFKEPVTTRLFFKALILLTFIKIVMLWPFSHSVMNHHSITLPRSWFGKVILAPAFLANNNVDIFFGCSLIFLAFVFFLRRHYATTGLFFWLTFNLYVVYLPFVSGADYVLFMLALWCIPMATRSTFKSEMGDILQKACYNAALILGKLQVVFIYLVSGWDKLMSKTWRSGEAFDYITRLGNLYNPLFDGMFDDPTIQLILSWSTILFELAFVVLVWFNKTRISMLLIGVFFHLFIWIVMSLPDFASVMIISYILFLKDTDYNLLPARIRQWLL
jgi:Vitamin K-dependent gamma-carboxylase